MLVETANSSVVASGRERATPVAPTWPAAPPRLSTTTILAQRLGEADGEFPADDVGAAAGGIGHDEGHRPDRLGGRAAG